VTQDSPTFEWVAAALEEHTTFDRLQARGTVRLALRKAGLEPGSVDRDKMLLVLANVMPNELRARKIENPEMVCETLCRELKHADLRDTTPRQEAPEDAFRRMFNN
jgi:hypothetical protein